MQKNNLPASTVSFKQHKTTTPEEILKAGGATVFGQKSGKSNSQLIKALQAAPPIEPFTEEEWQQTLLQLKNKEE